MNACDPTVARVSINSGASCSSNWGDSSCSFSAHFQQQSRDLRFYSVRVCGLRSEKGVRWFLPSCFFFAGGKERNAVPQLTDFEIPTSFWYELKSLTEILMDNVNREFSSRHVETRARADSYDWELHQCIRWIALAGSYPRINVFNGIVTCFSSPCLTAA